VGLKSIIGEVSLSSPVVASIARKLTPRLLESLKATTTYEVTMDSLDLLSDILYRFGAQLAPQSQAILDGLQPIISHPRPAARKRASVAMGYLVKVLTDKQYDALLGWLVKALKTTAVSKKDDLRSLVTCLGSIR